MTKWTYRQAWFCLIGSTLATLTLTLGTRWCIGKWQKARLSDEKSLIRTIIQTGPEKEALKTAYLAEVLSLSSDSPLSLYALNLKEARKKLISCPMIKDALLKRVSSGALYIDYTTRKPVAALLDYQNIGLDGEGYLFPLAPFFSPKHLPEIYLGLPPFGESADAQGRKGGAWLTPLDNKHLRLALQILEAFDDTSWKEGIRILRIDVSKAFAPSYGEREIVLLTEEEISLRTGDRPLVCLFPKILRLGTKNYIKQLGNFLSLRKNIIEDYKRQVGEGNFQNERVEFVPRIIDLRIPELALIQNS
jgi:hypothetical protein